MKPRSFPIVALSALTSVVCMGGLFAALLFLGTPATPALASGVHDHDFVGAERCRSCHTAEFEVWKAGPHARAFDALSDKDRKDASCLSCHTMVPDDLDLTLTSIQCETCHGAGRYYSASYVMRDEVLRTKLNLRTPTEKTCARCHTESTPSLTPFDFKTALESIRHWPADAAVAPLSP